MQTNYGLSGPVQLPVSPVEDSTACSNCLNVGKTKKFWVYVKYSLSSDDIIMETEIIICIVKRVSQQPAMKMADFSKPETNTCICIIINQTVVVPIIQLSFSFYIGYILRNLCLTYCYDFQSIKLLESFISLYYVLTHVQYMHNDIFYQRTQRFMVAQASELINNNN